MRIYLSSWIILVTLSILDLLFTVTLLEEGATEINPVIIFFLELGIHWAIAIKLVATIPWLFIPKWLATIPIACYTLVIAYEIIGILLII